MVIPEAEVPSDKIVTYSMMLITTKVIATITITITTKTNTDTTTA
jgi:hypothetical protein